MTPVKLKARFVSHVALYLALAIILPIGFHAFGLGGRAFLPMHIPVLLAGFIVGPSAGVIVGLLAPLLSFALTGMPPSYAIPLMSLELPIYGLIAGLFYHKLKINIYIVLIIAMIAGRIMFGLGLFMLGLIINLPYDAAAFFSSGGAIITGLPGIIVQLLAVPLIVASVKRKQSLKNMST